MQISVRFPVHVSSAIVPRHRCPKPVLAILRDEFEVKEKVVADYPLVARGEYQGSEVHEYRHRDGVFYSRPRFYMGQTIENALIQHFWEQTFRRQAEVAVAAFRPSDILPKGVAKAIILHGRISLGIPKLERIGRAMQLTAAGEAEVETVRAEFKALLDSVFLNEGELWVPTPEPMLSVARFSDRPMTREETHVTHVRMSRIPDPHSLGRGLYTFNQLEVARAFDHPSDNHPLKVEVFEPSVFSDEVPVGFSLSLLRYLSEEKGFPIVHRRRLAAFVNSDAPRDWNDAIVEIERLLSSAAVEGDYRRSLEIELERIDNRKIVAPFSMPDSERSALAE